MSKRTKTKNAPAPAPGSRSLQKRATESAESAEKAEKVQGRPPGTKNTDAPIARVFKSACKACGSSVVKRSVTVGEQLYCGVHAGVDYDTITTFRRQCACGQWRLEKVYSAEPTVAAVAAGK